MKNRTKNFVKNHQEDIENVALGAIIGALSIGLYTFGCRAYGYRMMKPLSIDDAGNFYLEGIMKQLYVSLPRDV